MIEVNWIKKGVKVVDEIPLTEEETQSLKEILEGKVKPRIVPNEYYLATIKTLEDNK